MCHTPLMTYLTRYTMFHQFYVVHKLGWYNNRTLIKDCMRSVSFSIKFREVRKHTVNLISSVMPVMVYIVWRRNGILKWMLFFSAWEDYAQRCRFFTDLPNYQTVITLTCSHSSLRNPWRGTCTEMWRLRNLSLVIINGP